MALGSTNGIDAAMVHDLADRGTRPRPGRDRSHPLLSGIVLTAVASVDAGAARLSAPLAARAGAVTVLVAMGTLSAVVATGMALSFHPAGDRPAPLLRSVQGAAAQVLIGAAVAPRINQEHRATLVSMNSLADRLGYGLLLAAVARVVAGEVVPRAQVGSALPILAAVSWVVAGEVVPRAQVGSALPILAAVSWVVAGEVVPRAQVGSALPILAAVSWVMVAVLLATAWMVRGRTGPGRPGGRSVTPSTPPADRGSSGGGGRRR